MEHSKLVATASSTVSGFSNQIASSSKDSVSTKQPRQSSSITETKAGGVSLIRQVLQNRGIQGESAKLILQAWRQSTQKQYECYLNKWLQFSDFRKSDPLQPTINVIIDFLYDLYKSGVQYSGIGTARSALSGFLSLCSEGRIDVGNSVLVKKFMRGVFNKRPALPKYIATWNPDQVLKYLESLGSELTLLQLSQKVCILLLLLTGQRGQSVHILKVEDVKFYENSLELNFSEVLKHTKPGKHQDKIILQSYKNKSLCIVSLLQLHLKRTSGLRGQEMQLFIRTQYPFKGCATISRWVKTIMKEAGIDVNLFKPHSTRAAASSAAKAKGVPLSATRNWLQARLTVYPPQGADQNPVN